MKPTTMTLVALSAAMACTGVWAARMPAACLDSDPSTLDTRTGSADVIENLALDTRVGSWDVTDFGPLDTFNSTGFTIIVQ